MLFNSWEFLALLVTAFALYHLPLPGLRRKVWHVTVLLVAVLLLIAGGPEEKKLVMAWLPGAAA